MIKFADMLPIICDFIENLLLGFDYPGLALALDPFTIALIASAVGKGVKGFRDRDEGEEMMRSGEQKFDEYSKKLMDIASEERELDQGFFDLEQATRQATELQRKNMQDMARRAEGTLLRNIDPRTAPNVTEAIGGLQRGTTQNLAALAGQDLGARATLLEQQKAVEDENFARKFGMQKYLFGSERDRAAASAEAGRQQAIAGENAMIDAIPQALGTYANLQASGLTGGGGASTRSAVETPNLGFGTGTGSVFGSDQDLGFNVDTSFLQNTGFSSLTPMQRLELGLPISEKDGGIVKAKAGMAMKTPGEFSHETNPQNVRAEDGSMVFENKKGEDVAEVTGDEIVITEKGKEEGVVVIPPKDQVSMQELIDKGDDKGLFDYFKNLLARFKEEAEQHEAMKQQMQQENG